MRKVSRIMLAAMLLGLLMTAAATAQTEGYIYGKVTLRNGNVYEGPIRWGKEEAFWTDIFNSEKVDDVFEAYLEQADGYRDLKRDLRDRRRSSRSFWGGSVRINMGSSTHSFKCRFGDIAKLDMRGRENIRLELKNGEEIRLSGGSNDVGATIRIMDPELDEISLKWRRIDSIEFMETPNHLKEVFGAPLYGTVKTEGGEFTGYIQWDHEECLGSDVLDGDSDDGDMEIQFKHIKSIEKYRRGCRVELKSGREYYLTGSNDVNSDNRGVVVKDPVMGKVLIGWQDFDSVVFTEAPGSGMAYGDFTKAKPIEGTVKTEDGKSFTGRIYYDLDEVWDLEMLDGEDGKTTYMVPFRSIKEIIPDGRWGSEVLLKNGKKLVLEESRDIDDDNAGLIVESGGKLEYIEWRDIESIRMK